MNTQATQKHEISEADLIAVREFLAGERDELPMMGSSRSGSNPDHTPVISRGIPRARLRATAQEV
ncbi:hypothetical protein EP7_002855 [Isosphaeraceae bacterium EP7]